MPIKQTIEIVWHTMTERPPRFGRYLVAEANCGFKDGQTLVRYDVNERSFGRRLWTHGQNGTPYAWAEKPKIRIGQGRPEWGAEHGKNYFVITWED